MEAHAVLGIILFYLGELALSLTHLEQRIALDDPLQHHTLTILYGGVDPEVHCLSYTIATLWLLGYPTQALKMSHETFTLARELSHPFSLAVALSWVTMLHQFRREEQTVQERAEAMITLCREKEIAGGSLWGVALQGWALAEQRQGEKGIAQIRQSLTAWRTVGRAGMQTYALALLAEAHGRAGQVEEGLGTLAEALAVVSKTAERWYEAELYRLKGQLTLQSRQVSGQSQTSLRKSEVPNTPYPAPNPQMEAEAEACFHKAIEIARKQSAKSLELRATMSLSRPWQSQGKQEEARQRLAEIYGWFTEGFDTMDLQEAKALLEQLNH